MEAPALPRRPTKARGLAPPELLLLTRAECELCEQMLLALQALGRRVPLPPVRLVDVDGDSQLRRRYGLKVPVLLLESSPICSGRLDEGELLAALHGGGRGAEAATSSGSAPSTGPARSG
jgi:hypothetical protein